MTITSPAFEPGGKIPSKFTCEGVNVNPPLNLENVPVAAQSLALIIDDPDASPVTFDHWLVWNIPPGNAIEEGSVPGVEGKTGFGENGYKGPCPPSGTHHYHFKVFALDTFLDLKAGADKKELEEAMHGHILGSAELTALYKKESK